MAVRGQFLERMTLIPANGLTLEGLYHQGEKPRPVVISAPHPHYGGNMDSPVVAEIAYHGYLRGLPTLRYNWRGVGASQGELGDEASSLEDLTSAVEHVWASTENNPVILAGYSYGAIVSYRWALANPGKVWKLILVAPPTAMDPFDRLTEIECPTLVLAGEMDTLSDLAHLKTLLMDSPGNHHLNIILDADHFFARGLNQLGTMVAEFV